MQKTYKSMVGLMAVAILLGLGIYFHRKPAPTVEPTGNTTPAKAAATTVPTVRVRTPTRMERTSEETADTDQAQRRREKVDEYLRLHNRNLASLLTAFHALQDTNFLNEAATNFPNDPRIQWTVLARNAFPEDRRKWLDGFKASSPSNSLGNYLSAQDYFKNNQPDAAMKELLAASGKTQFNDYSMETILDAEDLGRFSESPATDVHSASMADMSGDLLPELSNLKGVASGIRDLQQQYVKSGDAASVQTLAQAGIDLSTRLSSGDGGRFLISQLVGMATEATVLDSLDKNTAYDFLGGKTPAQRSAELKQERASFRDLTKTLEPILPTLNEDQMAGFWERQKIYGEVAAMRWLVQQNTTTPNSGN